MNKSSPSSRRIEALRARLVRFDTICTGNLRRRYAVCGTKNCRCKARPPARHGPYYYWSRLVGGKVVQRVLSREDAKIVARGIANFRKVKALLRKWEDETVRVLKASRDRKDRWPYAPPSRSIKLQTGEGARGPS